jgi:predicted ferric reductase
VASGRSSGDKGRRLQHEGTSGFGLGVPAPRAPAGPPPVPRPPPPVVTPRSGWTQPNTVIPLGVTSVMVVALVAAGIVAGAMQPVWHFLNFYTGVFALVALSISVMIGLAAADQLVLAPRQRLLAQAIHRAAAFTAVAMLLVHIICKIIADRATPIDAFVPFVNTHRTVAVGFGTLAAYLMILVTASGIVRARFAGRTRPWLWRTLHAIAYVSWPVAIIHGLAAGRSAAGWVGLSYIFCVLAVTLALPARFVTRARAGRQR